MIKQELTCAGLPAALYGAPAERVWLYLHGKGGCKEEAEAFAQTACPRGWQVLAVDLPEHGARRGGLRPLDGCPGAGAAAAVRRDALVPDRPALHQSGRLVRSAGLSGHTAGSGAVRLARVGYGAAHTRYDGRRSGGRGAAGSGA